MYVNVLFSSAPLNFPIHFKNTLILFYQTWTNIHRLKLGSSSVLHSYSVKFLLRHVLHNTTQWCVIRDVVLVP